MQKCKDCYYCWRFENSETTRKGICSNDKVSSYFMVDLDSECVLDRDEVDRCKNCVHYRLSDTACMTANENDVVGNCPGFEDYDIYLFNEVLNNLKERKKLDKDVLIEIINNF